MKGYVKISDFMNHLKENNLLIVSKNDFVAATEEDFNLKRSRLLKQRSVTLHEIVDGKFTLKALSEKSKVSYKTVLRRKKDINNLVN